MRSRGYDRSLFEHWIDADRNGCEHAINRDDWCRYLAAWVRVKAKWGLSMDESEYGRIKNLLEGDCVGRRRVGGSAPGHHHDDNHARYH